MARRNLELAKFLRSRREVLTPAAHGGASVRRVPGLRREEVAARAGLSVSYYTRIEQGEPHELSDAVLDGIAGALKLDQAERDHLARIARPGTPLPEQGDGEVSGPLRAMIEGNTSHAVALLGKRTDVLAVNAIGVALLGLKRGRGENMAKHVFLEPAARDLLVRWESEARRTAAGLRLASSLGPHDPLLAELIGELSMKSDAFARIWATYPVAECERGVYEFNHPVAGHLKLNTEALRPVGDPSQLVVCLSADPGSEMAELLRGPA